MTGIFITPMARIRRRFANNPLRNANQGTVLMEFAAGLPFFMLIGFGGAEYMNYITTHTAISQLALTVADNASRSQNNTNLASPQMRELDVNDIFKGADIQANKLDFANRGRIVLSSLEQNATNQQYIHWQRCFGKGPYPSSYGTEGQIVSGGMGPTGNKVLAPKDSAIMFVQVTYRYKPVMYAEWLSAASRKITYTAAFQIRDSRDLAAGVTNPSPTATKSACSAT